VNTKKKYKKKTVVPKRSGKLISTRDVAEMLGIDETTVTKYARAREIPSFKVGRLWRFPEKELMAFFED